MDKDIVLAIRAHEDQVGKIKATIVGLNFDDPRIKRKFLKAVKEAIRTKTPVTDASIGLKLPTDLDTLI